jgi:hypothetical protein
MSYDHWKTTNPDDEWLGPDPAEEHDDEEPPELQTPYAHCRARTPLRASATANE